MMITGYTQNGQFDKALEFFRQMQRADGKPNLETWNAMITGYARNGFGVDALIAFQQLQLNGHCDETLKIFIQMQLEGVKPDSFTVSSFLPECSNIAALQQGREIHNFIVRNVFGSSVFIANSLVDMYSKCGSLTDAHSIFDSIPQKIMVSWNAIIAGYGMHGYGEDALRLLSQMEQEKPNDITLIAIMTVCSHAGLVDEGWEQFDRMSQIHGIIPRVEHYTCIVDLLGCAGRLDEANIFIEKMLVEPDAGVWALFGACRIHRNIELGQRMAEHIF